MSLSKLGLRLTLGAMVALVTLLGLACASSRSHAPGHLYVSPRGSDRGPCTHSRPCRSITHAVAVAHAGEQIDVAHGSYPGQVVLRKRLTIRGFHSPIVDARGHGRGVLIDGLAAAGSVVRGLIVQNATYEGILALGTKRVTIADDVVRHNDRGLFAGGPVVENASHVTRGPVVENVSHVTRGPVVENVSYERIPAVGTRRVTSADGVLRDYGRALPAHALTGECKKNGEPPGPHPVDLRAEGCGEAIHLASTSDSRVVGNLVTDNSGGIYLTDESGPAAHNLIAHNKVWANVWDCAITLASHSRHAVTSDGRLRPRAGGVYDNTIKANVADDNGVRLPGAGILVAAALPGGGAYGNRIIANQVTGNGLPGVALHSHSLYQDINGNIIRDNVIGRNAVGGSRGGPGDGDAGIHQTAGILVWSWKIRITRIQVAGNRIGENYFGIWTKNVPRLRAAANHYRHVRVPLSQH